MNSNDTTATVPTDRYAKHATGPAVRWHGPGSRAAGRYGATWTADQVADLIPEGGAVTLYVSFGHVHGREGLGRRVMVRDGDSLAVIGPDGAPAYGYPLGEGRTLRLLVR